MKKRTNAIGVTWTLLLSCAVCVADEAAFQPIARVGYGLSDSTTARASHDGFSLGVRFKEYRSSFGDLRQSGLHVPRAIDSSNPIFVDEVLYFEPANLWAIGSETSRFEVSTAREISGIEIGKQFLPFPTESGWARGWRFDGYDDQLSFAIGDEVVATRLEPDIRTSWSSGEWLEDTSFAAYSVAGLRALQVADYVTLNSIHVDDGRAAVRARTRHQAVGPQFGIGGVAEASSFRLEVLLLGLVGYGEADIRQSSFYGAPAAGTAGSAATQVTARHSLDFDPYVAWQGEIRITLGCHLSERARIEAAWRGIVTGPIYAASQATVWAAPSYGLQAIDPHTAEFSSFFIGLSYRH